jgi:nicotinate-nucleotide adenylyltransferase
MRITPAPRPPHRRAPVASAEQRLHMARLAVADRPGFLVDDREYHRAGPSYTVLTLESLRAEFGVRPLCLLLGMDAFRGIEQWHQWPRLNELAHLILVARPGVPLPRDARELPAWAQPRLAADAAELKERPAGRILLHAVSPQDISATRIRVAVAAGQDVRAWLPPAVWHYIEIHNLYREPPH